MTQDHIREFLQVTLRQTWDQEDNIVIKHVQASKRDLAKQQCLLPPQGEPSSGLWPQTLLGVRWWCQQ